MICEEVRLHIGADPGTRDPAVAEHLRGCEACMAFQREMSALDGQIRLALETPLPSATVTPVTSLHAVRRAPRRRVSSRIWAMAASMLLALGLGSALWLGRAEPTLAHEVVTHVHDEPASWTRTEVLPAASVERALSRAGASLAPGTPDVVYAESCLFRGGIAPHLVVRTDAGPVTVMVLAHEPLAEARRFSEEGYTGVLVPAGPGSLAVLTRDSNTTSAELEAVAQRVRAALRWN